MDQAEGLRQLAAKGRLGRAPLRVFAVTSGKGGVGKTNATANMAVLAAKAGKRVLVLDADLGLANIEILLGCKPKHHIGDLLYKGVSLDDVIMEGPHGLYLLPAGSGVQSLTELKTEQKMQLINSLDALEDKFDVVFIDTGAGIGDNVCFFAGAAQESILVVSPEPTSLVDAYAAVKVLSQDAGVSRFAVLINPVVDELAARDIYPKLTSVVSRFLKAKIRLLGYIPRDENVHKAVMHQRVVVDMFPSAPSARAYASAAERLFESDADANLESGLKFMWQRLLRESQAIAG
ncbi:MAG: MinD/ParA family protein [Deltaproteobacteria bacterium]|nr:MinD/ParA family protein [Deltaproteobacteria bacterium]